MAVKVMVAPAIAKGEVENGRGARDPAAPPKPRRRRSSVYDADGNEVFLTLMCLKCHKMRPLSQFGLRKMADGAIRNQPWCRTCRSSTGAEKPRRIEEAAVPADPSTAAGAVSPPSSKPVPASQLAAEVAAAIVWRK